VVGKGNRREAATEKEWQWKTDGRQKEETKGRTKDTYIWVSKEKRACTNFRLLWPCIMNVGWRQRNQQDATNLMFIIKLLSQHVSGIIMPIIRRTRPCTTACGVLHWLCWLWLCGDGLQAVCTVWKLLLFTSQIVTVIYFSNGNFHTVHTACNPASHNHNQCRTPHAVVHGLVLLMMGIMMPETCWDRSLIINIRLVASCWFLSLHPMFMMHGHKKLRLIVQLGK